ncbi:hypothetical protein OUZ56_020025 [Daphnia magna]|uniref:Uncharacterized protein n=1 Tax=Daphnia magna TaxID=35525 RepID=A0ABQ9ZDC7_9CRUS|nr:hypothetical protein OUZ56_020025 [Daphnia magna]
MYPIWLYQLHSLYGQEGQTDGKRKLDHYRALYIARTLYLLDDVEEKKFYLGRSESNNRFSAGSREP